MVEVVLDEKVNFTQYVSLGGERVGEQWGVKRAAPGGGDGPWQPQGVERRRLVWPTGEGAVERAAGRG